MPTTTLDAPSLHAKYRRRLMAGLGIALVLRLLLVLLPVAFWTDLNTFAAWSRHLAEVGPREFYANGYFCDYPPGYMYVLGMLGWLHHLADPAWRHAGPGLGLETLLKLPAALADVATSYLLFKLLAGRVTIRSAYHGALAYAFNPAVIFVSTLWGQIDSVLTLMLVGLMWLLLTQRAFLAAMLGVLAVLVKPQGIFMAPFFVVSQWFRRPWWFWPAAAAAGIAIVWVVSAPFSPVIDLMGPFAFLRDRMMATAGTYTSSTVNAFNIWAPTVMDHGILMWGTPGSSDARTIFGIPHRVMGLAFVAILAVWVGIFLYRRRNDGAGPMFLGAALLFVGFFLFPTRMHERYIFPAMAFLTLAASANRYLLPNLWAFTATTTVNLLYVYLYYNNAPVFHAVPEIIRTVLILGSVLANMWFFGDALGYTFGRREAPVRKGRIGLARTLLGQEHQVQAVPTAERWERLDWVILGGAMALFFALGAWRLGFPDEQIFDEVYHARTAHEYLVGINPYEWTHPPLGKLLISFGIHAFGMNGFGWRIMSLLVGTLCLGIFFVLARRLFDRRRPAWIATLLLACDGVFFVQSRVAMTNIYVLLFLLAASLAAWEFMRRGQERYVALTGLMLGCALASRWSSMYAWGLLGLLIGAYVLFWERPRRTPKMIAWLAVRSVLYFTLIPLVVYLPCYIPYYGAHYTHWLSQVWDLQKMMWGYHSHLNATHSYASPWWQWPFMVRPTWYYYHDWKNGLISGIVAIGNPAIWWASIPALIGAAWVSWRRQWWGGWFMVVMGLGMYLPWAVQPRPLTFMHYMFETIPFACLAIAYFLDRLWRDDEWEPLASSYVLVAVGLFAFFYPLLSALPIPQAFYRMHIWFSTWV